MNDAPHRAFSLVELMIGIIILGLGMIMVATMFPIAWGRARALSEFTIQRNITETANAVSMSLVRVSGPLDPTAPSTGASLAGDLLFDPTTATLLTPDLNWPNDTWVHALNLQNIQFTPRGYVDEDPWKIEAPGLKLGLTGLPNRSYLDRQISFYQRVYPSLRPRDHVNQNGLFTEADDAWENALEGRRFCWAVFHRRLERAQFTNPAQAATEAASTRSFDMYYVTLRRPQSTFRYARQDPSFVPDPYNLSTVAVAPAALDADQDVMFPIPWRVQVQFPNTLVLRINPITGDPTGNATGIPTEITVPPDGLPPDNAAMVVQMFPKGVRFIDEITGLVFRVVKRRITDAAGQQAVLTLDREVVLEDIDLPAGDFRCGSCVPADLNSPVADPEELLRTVWVFPPPVAPGRAGGAEPTFAGGQPVVGIDVRRVNIAPTQ